MQKVRSFPLFPAYMPSPLRDLIWHHPCQVGALNTKVLMLVLLRVSLLSQWEFDLPEGKGESVPKGMRAVLIALVATRKL